MMKFVDHLTSDKLIFQCLENIGKARKLLFPVHKKPVHFSSHAHHFFQSRLQKFALKPRHEFGIELVDHFFQLKTKLEKIEYSNTDEQCQTLTTRDIKKIIQLFHVLGDEILTHNGSFCDNIKTSTFMDKMLVDFNHEMLLLHDATFDNVQELSHFFTAVACICFHIWKQPLTESMILKFQLSIVIFRQCMMTLFYEPVPFDFTSITDWTLTCSSVEQKNDLNILTKKLIKFTHHFLLKTLERCDKPL